MKFPRPSPSIFSYCKQSKTGVIEGLGTRLAISLLRKLTTARSHKYMYSLAPLTSAAAPWLHLLQLPLHDCMIDWYCYYSTKHSYCSLSTCIKSTSVSFEHCVFCDCVSSRTSFVPFAMVNTFVSHCMGSSEVLQACLYYINLSLSR